MHVFRRLIVWALCLVFVGGVGFGVFSWQRHRPRWVHSGENLVLHLSADGTHLVTIGSKDRGHSHMGPLQVWNTRNGALVAAWHTDAERLYAVLSPDHQLIATDCGDGIVRLIEWQTRAVHEIALSGPQRVHRLTFSPRGRWLYVHAPSEVEPHWVVDVAGRSVACRLPTALRNFNNDDNLAFCANGEGDGKGTFVWDLGEPRRSRLLETGTHYWLLSPDGAHLISLVVNPGWRPPPGWPRPEKWREMDEHIGLDVWDLSTRTKRFRLDSPTPGNQQVVFSPDGRLLAAWMQSVGRKCVVRVVELASGRERLSLTMANVQDCVFSPDATLCYFLHNHHAWPTLTMVDLADGKVLWEAPASDATRFAGASGLLVRVETLGPIQVCDARTGRPLADPPPNFLPMGSGHPAGLTPDSRHFTIHGFPVRGRPFWESWLARRWPEHFGVGRHRILVMETATGRELFGVPSDDSSRLLSDDADTLVTQTQHDDGTATIRAWNVRPHRAWGWAGVAMAGASAGVFVIQRLRSGTRKSSA